MNMIYVKEHEKKLYFLSTTYIIYRELNWKYVACLPGRNWLKIYQNINRLDCLAQLYQEI